MDFSPSPRAAELIAPGRRLRDRRDRAGRRGVPPPGRRGAPPTGTWAESPILGELRAKARAQGLWNLFLPVEHGEAYAEQFGTHGGAGLSNADYAPLAEQMGRATFLAPYVFNCNAPDTGNMEVLLQVRHRRAAAGVARAAARRADPLGVHDDRARRGLLRRDQHGGHRDRRRRRGRHQRPQVVVHRRRPPGLQDPRVHGALRPRRPTGTTGTRWCWCPLDTPGVKVERLLSTMSDLRRAGRPRRGQLHRRAGAEGEHPARRGPRLRDRPGPARPGPGAPLHAADRPGRGRARAGDQARPVARRRSASRWSTSAATGSGSPTPGSPSTRPGCWCSTPPGSSTSAAR